MKSAPFTLLCAATLLAAVSAPAQAQTAAAEPPVAAGGSLFPFTFPWNDAATGTATDASFLNGATPAGADGSLVIKNGHFFDPKTGRRVRFFGVNITSKSLFPSHGDADAIAAHLAKLGVNIVRIHQLDWDNGPLWDHGAGADAKFDPAGLDKLDYLISQLKRHGIYVDMNLHVTRAFVAADGFAPSVSRFAATFDKRVDNFDARMIALQKKYAEMLLTHVNPYTKMSYATDPCVAVVEINNENSLVGTPWADATSFVQGMPEPFKSELDGLWNAWLLKKYKHTTALDAAWTPRSGGPVEDALPAAPSWKLETPAGDASMRQTPADKARTAPGITVNVSKSDGTDWHTQAHIVGLALKNGETYVLTLTLAADHPRTVGVYSGIDRPNFHHTGLNTTFSLTAKPQTFRCVFTAQNVDPGHDRLSLTLGKETGSVTAGDLTLTTVGNGSLLLGGQTLEARTVPIPAGGTPSEMSDWVGFLSDTETEYADRMRAYLRDDLKVRAKIIDTQMSYGGAAGFARESGSDFADSHAYWQHPQFPGVDWDQGNWRIADTPMTADLSKGGGGTLAGLAAYRVWGRPYSVSEYNEPAPSDYQSEMYPILATFAAFQDWDMIYAFDYGSYGDAADTGRTQGFFAVGSNPAKAAFMPAAAVLFRTAEMDKAPGSAVLGLSRASQRSGKMAPDIWKAASAKGTLPDYFTTRLGVRLGRDGGGTPSKDGITETPGGRATSSLKVVSTPSGPQYLAVGGGAVAAAGYLGGQTVTLGPLTLETPPFGDNFASMMLTALDGKPLTDSHRLLLTVIGKTENTGMVWNAAHNSVGKNWGHDPSLAEGIEASVSLRDPSARHVWALDGAGRRVKEIPATQASGALSFRISPANQTVWYEIANTR